jgi:DNA end-binding protein Ku
VAIAQFVLRDKDHVCLLQPYKKALLLTTLNYAYEINGFDLLDEFKVPKLDNQELKLAELLISKLYKKELDMGQFKDTFAVRLAKAIKHKEKGKLLKPKSNVVPEEPLIEALRLSLQRYDKNHSKS